MSEEVFSTLGESIVNPRCDECGWHLSTPRPHEIGLPRLCVICAQKNRIEQAGLFRDFNSQERPDRRVHVVKLPSGMVKEPKP